MITTVSFDGTFYGFLTIIYLHYYEKLAPSYIFPEGAFQQVLGAEYLVVETDYEKAKKVYDAIEKKISLDALERTYHAFLSADEDKFMAIYRYLLLGFRVGRDVDRYQTEDYVRKVHKIATNASHEAHILTGFARFRETKAGVFYAEIESRDNVLPLLAEHFADRFMNHPWIIHDKKRNQAAIYDGNNYMIAETPAELVQSAQIPESTEAEEEYQELWAEFFKTIAIKDRINPKLQKRLMNSRFMKKAPEFKRGWE